MLVDGRRVGGGGARGALGSLGQVRLLHRTRGLGVLGRVGVLDEVRLLHWPRGLGMLCGVGVLDQVRLLQRARRFGVLAGVGVPYGVRRFGSLTGTRSPGRPRVPRPCLLGAARHPGQLRRGRVQRYRPRPYETQLDGLARQYGIQEPVGGHTDAVAGHRGEVVAAGDRARGHSGQGDAQRVGGGLDAAEVDDEAQVAVTVGAPLPQAQRRGDVVRHGLALPPGVLGGHRRVGTGLLQVGHRGRVPGGEQAGPARHLEVGVDEQPALLQGKFERFGERVGPYADAPHEGAGVDELAVGQQHPAVRGLLHGGAHPHLDAPLPQHPVGGA